MNRSSESSRRIYARVALGATAALLVFAAGAHAGAGSTVPPPPAPGAWHQLGAAVTSRPGKGTHFFRTALSPQGLGVVVRSSSTRPIHGAWSSWCEIADDDGPVEQLQGALTGVKTVIAYPHVLSGATRCYVSVYTRAPGPTAKTVAAEFSY